MNNFKKNIVSIYGESGRAWLNYLPDLVEQLAVKWDLDNFESIDNLSYNYVIGCVQNNNHVILKLGLDKLAVQNEADALRYFSGHGCVKILDQDYDRGALLIERVILGKSLKNFFPYQDAKAIKITSKIIDKFQKNSLPPDNKKFKDVAHWLAILDKNWNIPLHHLEKARVLSKYLLNTTTKSVLLHGDLHHYNILSNGKNSWIAIDPKGVIGDPIYEVGAFIRNPMSELFTFNEEDIKNILQNRIKLFSEFLRFDEKRIFQWTYVQSVLATCWALEDKMDPSISLKVADMIDQL